MADKLLPCPFCGGEAEWSYLVPDGAIIGCKDAYSANPKCRIKPEIRRYRGNKEKSLEIAISDWNNRPSPWHTGTPTEIKGWYLLKYKWYDEIRYITMQDPAITFFVDSRTIGWKKIEED